MALMEWSKELSVDIDLIDEQHKKLISYVNDLHENMKVGKGKDIISKILDGLIEYTKFHFNTEEELFAKYNYPERENHVSEHHFFVDKVKKFQDDFNNGRLSVTIEVFQFLNNWVTNHIKVIDKKYSPFLKGKM